MVFLLLSGRQRFVLGGQRIEMDARRRPDGALLRISAPTELTFEINAGAPLTKLSLAMPLDWLDTVIGAESGPLSALPEGVGVLRFLPEHAMCDSAEQTLRESAPLRRMALGMALLDQVMATIAAPMPQSRADLIARLRREIAATAGVKLTTAQLARRMGLGLRSLERQVCAQTGESLGAFLRAQRFDLALQELRTGASVFAAARVAGFSSAENFATAFRQHYGVSPSELRAKAER